MSKKLTKIKKFFKILILKPWIILDAFIINFLTYNYESPYFLREYIYKARIIFIPKLKTSPPNCIELPN